MIVCGGRDLSVVYKVPGTVVPLDQVLLVDQISCQVLVFLTRYLVFVVSSCAFKIIDFVKGYLVCVENRFSVHYAAEFDCAPVV